MKTFKQVREELNEVRSKYADVFEKIRNLKEVKENVKIKDMKENKKYDNVIDVFVEDKDLGMTGMHGDSSGKKGGLQIERAATAIKEISWVEDVDILHDPDYYFKIMVQLKDDWQQNESINEAESDTWYVFLGRAPDEEIANEYMRDLQRKFNYNFHMEEGIASNIVIYLTVDGTKRKASNAAKKINNATIDMPVDPSILSSEEWEKFKQGKIRL